MSPSRMMLSARLLCRQLRSTIFHRRHRIVSPSPSHQPKQTHIQYDHKQAEKISLATGLVQFLYFQINNLNVPSGLSITWLILFWTIWQVEIVFGLRLFAGLVKKQSTLAWSCVVSWRWFVMGYLDRLSWTTINSEKLQVVVVYITWLGDWYHVVPSQKCFWGSHQKLMLAILLRSNIMCKRYLGCCDLWM